MNTILQQRIEEAKQKEYPLPPMVDGAVCKVLAMAEQTAYTKGANFALQNQWISVDEDLPKYDEAVIAMEYQPELSWEDQRILFAHRSKNPDVCRDKNDFCIYPPTIMKITHWMETPRLEGGEK